MPIYIGNQKLGSLYLGSTKIKEAWVGNVKVFGANEDPDLYFDFGTQYTLNTGTPGSVDLSNTKLQYASKPYIAFSMSCSIDDLSTTLEKIKISGDVEISGSTVEVYTDLHSVRNPDDMEFQVNYGTNERPDGLRIISNGSLLYVKMLGFIFFVEDNKMVANIGYKAILPDGQHIIVYWRRGITVINENLRANIFRSISTPGYGYGAITVTGFKSKGFDELQDAKHWALDDD